jgi:hypothetical protein
MYSYTFNLCITDVIMVEPPGVLTINDFYLSPLAIVIELSILFSGAILLASVPVSP